MEVTDGARQTSWQAALVRIALLLLVVGGVVMVWLAAAAGAAVVASAVGTHVRASPQVQMGGQYGLV